MTVDEILAAIPALSVLVVGDVCLDRWCRYDPRLMEPSRETGIPRVAVVEFERTPGAAGTVASNLAALGAGHVAVLGVVGCDGHGYELELALGARGIDATELVRDSGALTFTYTKLINHATGIEDLPRIDYFNSAGLPPETEAQLVERFERLAPRFDAVIVSDQMERGEGGVVSGGMRVALTRFAESHTGTLVWVDSRARAELFHGTLVKLNEAEAEQACMRIGVERDYELLRRRIGHPTLIVTRGAEGALVVTRHGATAVPTQSSAEPVDICGAGDSFNAGAALALRLTNDPVAAARFGNLVASITVMKPGTGTATPAEVSSAAHSTGR